MTSTIERIKRVNGLPFIKRLNVNFKPETIGLGCEPVRRVG